jgi:hypothetical protein
VAEALYRKLELSTELEVVWERVRSGWDWLGVTNEGEFVVGYPARTAPAARSPEVTIATPGARDGAHGVRVTGPLGTTTTRWYATAARAAEEFARTVNELRAQRSGRRALALVQRIEEGAVVEELVVASA